MNDAIQRVIDRLTIEDVAHLSGTIWVDPEHQTRQPEEAIEILVQMRSQPIGCSAHEFHGLGEEAVRRYRVVFELGLRILDERKRPQPTEEASDKESIIAIIEATMYGLYAEHVKDDLDPIDDVIIEEFGRTNALYHIWPYWREYVQSSLTRLRLPPITVPMFRLPESNWRKCATAAEQRDVDLSGSTALTE